LMKSSKGLDLSKLMEKLYLQESEWELCSISNIICGWLLIGNDIELLKSVKEYLNSKFSMKDLGEAAYILGIKIYRDRSRRLIGLSQSTYHDSKEV
jgi:hypothetical protein